MQKNENSSEKAATAPEASHVPQARDEVSAPERPRYEYALGQLIIVEWYNPKTDKNEWREATFLHYHDAEDRLWRGEIEIDGKRVTGIAPECIRPRTAPPTRGTDTPQPHGKAYPARKDSSLEQLSGTPEEIALALHNDAVTRGGAVPAPRGDSLRDIVRKYDEMLEPISSENENSSEKAATAPEGADWQRVAIRLKAALDKASAERDAARRRVAVATAHAAKLAEEVSNLTHDYSIASLDKHRLDLLETLVFTNREGEKQLGFDFTMPTLREAIDAAIAARQEAQ